MRMFRMLLSLAVLLVPGVALAQSDALLEGEPAAAAVRKPALRRAAVLPAAATPAWSYGLSFPVTRFGFSRNADGTYGGSLTPLQAGIGTSVFWNAVRAPGGSVPVGLGALLFGATDLASDQSDAGVGIAIGPSFWNNTFALMVGVDLYRKIGSKDTGLLMASAGGRNGFARDNVFILFNFGIGLGKSAPGDLKIAP